MLDVKKDSTTENYLDMEQMLYKITHKFIGKYGGDFEEIMSRARFYFMEADATYVRDTSKWERTTSTRKHINYSTWVHSIVYYGLLREHQKDIRIKRFRPEIDPLHSQSLSDEKGFTEFLADLQTDARTVVDLVLHTPSDLMLVIRQEGGQLNMVKRSLYKYLRQSGWCRARIFSCFNEIEKALCK